MADDRFFCSRVVSISVTVFASDAPRACAISFSPLQNASSRLMLVLCPLTKTERLMIRDFMASPFEHICDSRGIVPCFDVLFCRESDLTRAIRGPRFSCSFQRNFTSTVSTCLQMRQ